MTKNKYEGPKNTHTFRDAEQLWFWFISSARIRTGLCRAGDAGMRPCEMVDIETFVTRLYLSGRLSRDQLVVMKQYGERRRAPSQHVWAENKDAAMWMDAMRTLQIAASAKGWIE